PPAHETGHVAEFRERQRERLLHARRGLVRRASPASAGLPPDCHLRSSWATRSTSVYFRLAPNRFTSHARGLTFLMTSTLQRKANLQVSRIYDQKLSSQKISRRHDLRCDLRPEGT